MLPANPFMTDLCREHLSQHGEVVVSVGPVTDEHQRVYQVRERVREVRPQRQGLTVARDRLQDVATLLTEPNRISK